MNTSKECGVTQPLNNSDTYDYTKDMTGDGQAIETYSYPATVLVSFSYSTSITINNNTYLPSFIAACFGTLINRRTVMTAASCLPSSLPFSPSGYGNDSINIPVVLDDFYPDLQSIYSVYVGVNKYISSGSDVTPTQLVTIDSVILVSCTKKINHKWNKRLINWINYFSIPIIMSLHWIMT